MNRYPLWKSLLFAGVMILALAHSILAGTDTEAAWAGWLYLATAIALSACIVLRVVSAAGRPRDVA